MAERLPLSKKWNNCRRCELWETRENIVHGVGDDSALVYFVGQNPGRVEDETGEPWKGAAGTYFKVILSKFKWSFESVFVDNGVMCAPWEKDEERNKWVITKAKPAHFSACRQRLFESIYYVDPLIVVALGKEAYQTLTGKTGKVGDLRQEIFPFFIPGVVKSRVQYSLAVTYNPAHLVNYKGKPVDENGLEYTGVGSHKQEHTLQNKFHKDLAFVFEHVQLMKELHSGERKEAL